MQGTFAMLNLGYFADHSQVLELLTPNHLFLVGVEMFLLHELAVEVLGKRIFGTHLPRFKVALLDLMGGFALLETERLLFLFAHAHHN
jgi:hypothetical protein